jgi:phosphodiesterase/alkaline phosphatase D-like protein
MTMQNRSSTRARRSVWVVACLLGAVASCAQDDSQAGEQGGSCASGGRRSAEGGRDAEAPTIDAASAKPTDAAAAEPPPSCDAESRLTYGPVLGAITDRSVKVWARADRAGAFFVLVWREDTPERVRTIEGPRFVADDGVSVALIDQLEPDTRYGYQLQHGECTCPTSYSFETLPARGSPARIRFATAGDVEGPDVPGFADIAAVDPSFVLMVGDNVYADGFGMDEEAYRRRYDAVWGGAQFRELFARRPTFMIWDDHELVDNYWIGKNDTVYELGRRLYQEYQGSHNPDPLVEGELYYTFEAADVGFFVLDTRSHRSRNGDPDGPDKSMLGSEQKQRLLSWLAANEYRVHVILSSVLMSDFSTTGNDSWSGFRDEREEILAAIATAETNHVIVISGDQHWSAILRLDRGEPPYSIYEFQATPLGFEERGAPLDVDDRVLALDNTHQVFSVFDIDTRTDLPTIDYTLCAVGQACQPHDEPGPVTGGSVTTVPYSVGFEGRDRGFELVSGL